MFNIRNEALSKASFQNESESICLIEHVGGPRNSANHNADHISQGPSSVNLRILAEHQLFYITFTNTWYISMPDNPSYAEQQFIMLSLPFTLHTQAVLFTHVRVTYLVSPSVSFLLPSNSD